MKEWAKEDYFRAVMTGRVRMMEEKLEEVGRTIGVLGARVSSVSDVLDKMAREPGEAEKPAPPKPEPYFLVDPAVMKDKSRKAESVALRWSIWRAMYECGMSTKLIAQKMGVDRGTVDYARSKGFRSGHSKPGMATLERI